jgi:hypothetical protein
MSGRLTDARLALHSPDVEENEEGNLAGKIAEANGTVGRREHLAIVICPGKPILHRQIRGQDITGFVGRLTVQRQSRGRGQQANAGKELPEVLSKKFHIPGRGPRQAGSDHSKVTG